MEIHITTVVITHSFFFLCFYELNEFKDDNLTGVAVVIAGSTLSTATKLSSFGNDSLCNVASTRYILYKTQTLFRDTKLSNDTSVDSQIISVQVGKEPLDNLKDPNVISFDILSGKSAVSSTKILMPFLSN